MNTEKAERKRKTSHSLSSVLPWFTSKSKIYEKILLYVHKCIFLILVSVDFYCEDYKSWIFDARIL